MHLGLITPWAGGYAQIHNQNFKNKKSIHFFIHGAYEFPTLDICSVNELALNKIKTQNQD